MIENNGDPISKLTPISDSEYKTLMRFSEIIPGFVATFSVEDDGLKLIEANNRFREFFDCYDNDNLSCGLSNYYTEKNQSAFDNNFLLMQRGEPVHFTIHAKDHNDRDVWFQINADCIDRMEAHPVYLVIYLDITDLREQRELQRQLEERSRMLCEALDAAEQANKSKSDFLSRMSHDIRTPMNAIMGMTSIASSHIDDKERVLDCLGKIDVSSRLLMSLINEVLDMSKIESGRIAMANFRVKFSLPSSAQGMPRFTIYRARAWEWPSARI